MKRKIILATLIMMATCMAGVGLCACGRHDKNPQVETLEETIADGNIGLDLEPFTESEPLEDGDLVEEDGDLVEEDVSEERNLPVELHSKYEKAAYFADRVAAYNQGQNILVSPLSLDMALGMAGEGATGTTKEELLRYLGTDDYGKKAEKYLQFMKELTNGRGNASEYYEIANSVWANKEMTLKKSYKQRVSDCYSAEVDNVDFGGGKEKTVKRINKWCSEKTHKMIPEIITPADIDESLAAVLVNALYFESAWVDEWGVNQDTFTDWEGNETTQDMLVDTLHTYYENDKATAFSKYYKNGMSFIGILPKEEGDFNLADLDLESLLASGDSHTYDVHAKMPKLNYDSNCSQVAEILQDMGVHTAFDENNADFSEMMDLTEDQRVYISKIIQKCKIELDEKGTKAAAVTAIMMRANSAAPIMKEQKQVYLDRPFAYLIYDEVNDEILFAGKVLTPEN